MKKCLIGSLLLLIILVLPAQRRAAETFRLVHSDKLFLNRSDTEQVLELNGNVHFFYGKTEFKANRALILDTSKIARLTGNVVVANDTLTLSADSLAYYRNSQQMNLGGRVRIDEVKPDGSQRWFSSDFANYDQLNQKLTTWGNVKAYDLMENAFASCGYAFWDRKAGYAYMIENPRLHTGSPDTLFIAAERIEYFDEEEKIVATFGVKVDSQDYHATSDFLLYFVQEEKAVFTGMPVFRSGFATAQAREFYLYFTERELTRAELVDSCRVDFAEEEGAGQTNWVLAEYVRIGFNGKNLRDFRAENGVSYYYQQEEEEERDFFQNRSTGQYLEAMFTPDSKLEYIRMRDSINGVYRFRSKT
jgi:lipopolysaccharide export system protein LptA